MRLRYPALQNVVLDRETEDHDFVPGQWRQNVNMHDVGGDLRGRNTTVIAKRQRECLNSTVIAKRQRECLNQYFNSPVDSVSWQERMIQPRQKLYRPINCVDFQLLHGVEPPPFTIIKDLPAVNKELKFL